MNLQKKRSQLLRKFDATKSFQRPATKPLLTKPDVTVEVVFENERATILSNQGVFTKKSLLPTDSPAFCDIKDRYVIDIRYFAAPSGWEWVSEWMVDMNGAVDGEGWSYNSSFLSKQDGWKLSFEQVRNSTCVRRRKWTRMRRLQGFSSPVIEKKVGMEVVIGMVQQQRSDREKLLVLKQYVDSSTITDPVLYATILSELEHDTSLLDGCMLIASLAKDHLELIRACTRLLVFGSDKMEFLHATNLHPSQYHTILE
jgi:hypothetical protein